MKSILLIRYSALGDVVLATSLIEPLRAKYPGVRIEWVVDAAHAELVRGVVDDVIPFSRRDGASRAAVLHGVKGRFDLAIDLQNKLWSMRVARAAAPQRLRLVRRTPLQALGSLIGFDTVLDGEPTTELYAKAAGLERAGRVRLQVSEEARAVAARALPLPAERGEGRGEGPSRHSPWIAIAPGAAWETKRWSPERFGELAATLRADGYRVALLGGPMDGALLDAVRARCTIDADLTAESLPVLAAALERTKLLVGNDSGLVHVALAVGARPLALFGPTSVKRWGPSAPGKALSLGLSCAPCSNHGTRTCPKGHHDCLGKLEVAQVLAEARALLA